MQPAPRFYIVQLTWPEAEAQAMELRLDIFHQEQGIDRQLMTDEQDADALHFLLYDEGHAKPVATARMLTDGRIGRVATLKPFRGQGFGKSMMSYMHDIAAQRGIDNTQLHAQHTSIDFYQQLGYIARGDTFEEAGIPHQAMTRAVDQLDRPIEFTADHAGPRAVVKAPSPDNYNPKAERPADSPIETSAKLGFTGALPLLRSSSEIIDHIAALIAQADQKVFIYAPTLIPQLFADPKVLQAISKSARRNPLSQVQLLINDPEPLIKQHHPLLQLQQRINSLITLRCTVPSYPVDSLGLILADTAGWLELTDDNPLTLRGNFNDTPRVKQWQERIKHAWNHSIVPLDIRQMSL
ncbi:GNAT family N-acetyltransferase [Aestuariirhabdus sp. Z084]|uniref:GNAT family N-acetyltransferase n=1 Tax=Aestuariirhabdus haliotis TaxID=2918751 RepID=UPI00201B365D|nr:GNAT family N-acetyltransferase [Aestuariirhabdus haliotis]MCL6414898.1 GNAT family N-acetyltransferase [Aestuariirhabdus haliotis]MCL6418830.1 GNAT family N-acetyltransferase [Aestuariirhabdus haliotis]